MTSFSMRLAPADQTTSVEYTSRGKRVVQTFSCMFAARRFYSAKFKAGAEPHVVKVPK